MQELVNQYLDDFKGTWSSVTLERRREYLNKLLPAIKEGPEALLDELNHLAPYSFTTVWGYAVHFWDWYMEEKLQAPNTINPFRQWRKKNGKKFKNTYTRQIPQITYDQAKTKIAKIKNPHSRAKAYQLLKGGLRWSESKTINTETSEVTGKGGKRRYCYVKPLETPYPYSKMTFNRHLKKATGLKPHDLRKIRATDLARRGLQIQDICQVLGWSSFATASSYIAARRRDEIVKLLES